MHELSIMQSLVETLEAVVRRQGARRVVRVVIEVGEMSNVIPTYLRNAWDAFREVKPFLAQAELEICFRPLRLRCDSCRLDFHPWEMPRVGEARESCVLAVRLPVHRYRCLQCSSPRVQVLQGEELRLRDIELEV